eukprot:3573860-Pyramimonas_sp.AAC.1
MQTTLRLLTLIAGILSSYYFKDSFLRQFKVSATYNIQSATGLVGPEQLFLRNENVNSRGICASDAVYGVYNYSDHGGTNVLRRRVHIWAIRACCGCSKLSSYAVKYVLTDVL